MKNKLLLALGVLVILTPFASADLKLDNVQFDPAIVASGDHVDIVVQYHDTGSFIQENHIGDPSYTLKMTLEPDDSLSKQYVLIEDSEGRDLQGIITRGDYFNKRFRVKVNDNAPAGDYGFKIIGQWYHNGQPTGDSQYIRFSMPVKKEGISLSVANIVSTPEKIRAGDKNILLTTSVTNTGEKSAKNVRITLRYPSGITSSYTNNNDLNIGSIAPNGTQSVQLYIDTDRYMKEGLYPLNFTMTYQDTDNNEYGKSEEFPIMVKKKPHIIVTGSEGSGFAGDDIELKIFVQNIGEETADSVDVRILKQSSQPFSMDLRSDYVGQLEPGENGTAVLTIDASDEAEIKEHRFNVIIRARGDSEEGDDNVYTFTDTAKLTITGKKPNRYPLYAAAILAIAVVATAVRAIRKRQSVGGKAKA